LYDIQKAMETKQKLEKQKENRWDIRLGNIISHLVTLSPQTKQKRVEKPQKYALKWKENKKPKKQKSKPEKRTALNNLKKDF